MARSQKSKQLEFRLRTWGGKRKGAGRKRVAPRARVPHVRRAEPRYDRPILVTVRICDGVPSLRTPSAWAAIVRLLRKARGRFGMHIVAYEILRNHLHMIVECDHPDSLERGMRGLNTRIARQLNKVFGRRGKLIDHRYHSRELCTKDFGTSPPRTWLLKTGWKRHGLLELDELPDERPPPINA